MTDKASDAADKQQTFHVKVYSPFKLYYDAPATSISAANETGPFDILPKHRNFLTLLAPGELVIAAGSKEPQKIRISQGIMQVKADEVTVFLDA